MKTVSSDFMVYRKKDKDTRLTSVISFHYYITSKEKIVIYIKVHPRKDTKNYIRGSCRGD